MKLFDSTTVKAMTGIHVKDGYNYELREMEINDISGIDLFKNEITSRNGNMGDKVDSMLHRLRMGGSLPAIILWGDLTVADGTHRMFAHILAETRSVFVLIRRPLMGIEAEFV